MSSNDDNDKMLQQELVTEICQNDSKGEKQKQQKDVAINNERLKQIRTDETNEVG